MCVLIPTSLSETFLVLRRIRRDIITHVHRASSITPIIVSDFNLKRNLWADFQMTPKHQISWQSDQWEPICFTGTDGQTDRHDEANSRISQFCEHA